MSESTRHRWAVDDIQAGVARIEEDGVRMITVPLTSLPHGVKAGQILVVLRSENTLSIELDEAATREVLAKSKATTGSAMAESRRRDPGGDVSL